MFAPYFVRDVVGDPIRGQLLVAGAAKWAGWGGAGDYPGARRGDRPARPRKPWLFGSVMLMVPLTAALWWVAPGGAIGIPAALVILAVMGFLLAASDMLHNALLLPAAGMAKAGAASGLALALVNALSVASLAFVVWAFALPGKVAWGFIPAHPLFGLDPATHQTDRIVAPITAGLMLVGSIPLFAFVKDVPATGTKIGAAIRGGTADLIALAREARGRATRCCISVASCCSPTG